VWVVCHVQREEGMIRTRLDTVVTVKERAEEKAGQDLVKAEAAVERARIEVEDAKRQAARDHRGRTDASNWEMTEAAHHRALTQAQNAQRHLEALQKSAALLRSQYVNAHRAAEVVRRVATSRREEVAREADRVETKALDEASALLFVRKAG
jgi:flagellar export protein FliJ